MIELFGRVWPGMPKRVINTHEDGDHVWGNQLFEGAEIIAHRSVPERMRHVAHPEESGFCLTKDMARATSSGRTWSPPTRSAIHSTSRSLSL
jgi:glyoxylase-like metal-dependent hydrolase (beta-lactamase superfamily II)